MVTIRRLALGSGFKYLMESIAAGDGPAPATSLAAYYEASGTPPGVWMGAGLAGLAGGNGVAPGSIVKEAQLLNMLGRCVDPVTGEPCGRRPNPEPAPLSERVAKRAARLPGDLTDAERTAALTEIVAQEQEKTDRFRPPVAAFDLTFSPQKSVSVAWALADRETQARLYECHRRAVQVALEHAEEQMIHSRSGTNGVLQEDVRGVVAAAFTHYDSRAGDPQLHDHVVVWNRAQSCSDGRWRTLDSRGLYKQVVTLSEIYDGLLEDLITAELGVGWERGMTRGGQVKAEIAGVGKALMAEFSQRRHEIDAVEAQLTDTFVREHGRRPTPVEKRRIAQQANLQTRRPKQRRSLAQMSAQWRQRARPYVGDGEAWVATLAHRNDLPALRERDLGREMLSDLAEVARERTAERRATFTRANVLAEVHRQLRGVRFASDRDRMAVAQRSADLALGESVMVSAPELHHVPERYVLPDGTSMLRPADQLLYTTSSLLDAEHKLLDAGRRVDGPTVSRGAVARVTAADLPGRRHRLGVDQALAVEKVATSGRALDVLVGPAGTGKTTTLAGLRTVWEAEHGRGSVVGLAPSAAAADVLAGELGIATENTAKWLFEHQQRAVRRAEIDQLLDASERSKPTAAARGRLEQVGTELAQWSLRKHQLVIVDEASMAGTFMLEELATAARETGAKLLLVGDPYQLSAVEAGGMFAALVRDRADEVAELEGVHRFTNRWEKEASLRLREGEVDVVEVYERRGRVVGGNQQELIAQLYEAWKADVDKGLTSLMIAADVHTAAALNRRARSDRIDAGLVSEASIALAGDQRAGVGDEIVTRQNDRRLNTERGWVKNGDRWIVTAIDKDGSLAVRRSGGGGTVRLPAAYVAENVEPAYATTARRAQGRTVDTAHSMVSPVSTRETLYVSATRGRESNTLYVDVAYDPDPPSGHPGTMPEVTPAAVLCGVLANSGASLAAHAQIRDEWDRAASLEQLMAEYQTFAQAAQGGRWEKLVCAAGLADDQIAQVLASDAYGPLTAALRDAEAHDLNVDQALPGLVATRSLSDAGDIAAVLHARVDEWVARSGGRRASARNLIAGLIPRAQGVTDEDFARALKEREDAIERRATSLLEQAITSRARWLKALGPPPANRRLQAAWLRDARTVAAYRERWGITTSGPLDGRGSARTLEQATQQKRAAVAAMR
ncbi:MAG: relaxase domain-containing protein, partial [Conexibacteraceae bacterium]|nr:relaxase domain-containing protein [Conexibacteraceae bacterium]